MVKGVCVCGVIISSPNDDHAGKVVICSKCKSEIVVCKVNDPSSTQTEPIPSKIGALELEWKQAPIPVLEAQKRFDDSKLQARLEALKQETEAKKRKSMSAGETKQCPYCAETIKKEAGICRFCQIDLTTGQPIRQRDKPSTQPREVQARSGVVDGVKLGCGMFVVLPILIFFGLLCLLILLSSH